MWYVHWRNQQIEHSNLAIKISSRHTIKHKNIFTSTYSDLLNVSIILRVSFCSDIWYCNILAYYPGLRDILPSRR
jgi:hypothetical protein